MKRWEIVGEIKKRNAKAADIVKVLLKNRGILTKEQKQEFIKPAKPEDLSLRSLKIKTSEIQKAIKRIKKAKKSGEKVVIYGDYDADGICATAILWESLYSVGLDVLPHIPERFSEGYGINIESIKKLRSEYKDLKLIITVDNGIVAFDAVDYAGKLGIDIIVSDHHQKGKKNPNATALIHTTKISGAGVSWIFTREIRKALKVNASQLSNGVGLDLAAIGTIADQLPLIGPNRSFAKYGLNALNKTKRRGLVAIFQDAAIQKNQIGTYEINFIIAPRLNAMGRLEHAIESLRLICTKSKSQANNLARTLGKTNVKRQRIVDEVITHARDIASKKSWKGVVVLAHRSYHEGVIGLAASKLVEEHYRPAIVISKGKKYSKASARSISGFNIIEAIKMLDGLLVDSGGHPMAAGFTLETKNIEDFMEKLDKVTEKTLTDEILERKLKVDTEVEFSALNWALIKEMSKFKPFGIGNPTPSFLSKKISVKSSKRVGISGKHLKLTLKQKNKAFDAIAFGFGDFNDKLSPNVDIDVVFSFEVNLWNGQKSLQLKIKDMKQSSV